MVKNVVGIKINRSHIQDLYLAGTKEQFRILSLSMLDRIEELEEEVKKYKFPKSQVYEE